MVYNEIDPVTVEALAEWLYVAVDPYSRDHGKWLNTNGPTKRSYRRLAAALLSRPPDSLVQVIERAKPC